jgi:microcystin-dependent protein
MSSDPFLGQVKVFGFNFAPRFHAQCNGQLLSIAQNTALFSLLGTTFGGNGQTTFGLPDLRGRVPIHFGQGPGLSPYSMGQIAGQENHTLILTEMPQHNHLAVASSNTADQTYPPNNLWANAGSAAGFSNTGGSVMNGQSLSNAGGSQPHNNMQPYTVVNYCITLAGIFPSRN